MVISKTKCKSLRSLRDPAILTFNTATLVSCPDPTPKRGRGSGTLWAVPWSCWLNSYMIYGGIMQSLVILATCTCTLILAVSISHISKHKPAIWLVVPDPELSSQQNQETAWIVPDPLPRLGVGSGHETTATCIMYYTRTHPPHQRSEYRACPLIKSAPFRLQCLASLY